MAPQQHRERIRNRLEERLRHPTRRHGPERVAHEPSVLGGHDELALAEPHADRPSLAKEGLGEARVVLAPEERPRATEQVVQLVGIPRRAPQRRLDIRDRARVEQLAQLLDAHQLAQETAVERECLRAALLGGRVVLVHVRGDVVEEERGREGRRGHGLHFHEVELTGRDPAQDPLQGRQVEDVLEHLAVGLEHDRELRIAARDLEQRLRLQPLLPERRPLPGPPTRDEERARGVLAEARAEQRRLRELREDELLDLVRVELEVGERRRRVRVGEVQRDAVVRPERVRVEVERVAQARGEREPPRRVHAATERREHADAPVADLVAEALDDDRAVRGDDAGRAFLLAQEG